MRREGEGGSNTSVQNLQLSRPLSAEFILRVVLVQQFDVREGEMTTFAFTFTLPLAVHIYFGHLHCVAHLRRERRGRCNSHTLNGTGGAMEENIFTPPTSKTIWIIIAYMPVAILKQYQYIE